MVSCNALISDRRTKLNTMRTLVPLLGLLLISMGGFAQKPRLTLHADIGACRTYLSYYDAYANPYQKNHATAGLGASLRLKLGYAVSFDPEIGFQAVGMHYDYTNARTSYDVYSKITLGYLQLSPMLTFGRQVGFAAGFSVMASAISLGNLEVWQWSLWDGWRIYRSYKGLQSELRNPVTWGPRFLVKAGFPTKAGHTLGFRVGAFLHLNRVFLKDIYTGINPRFVQVFLGFTYSPTQKKQ
jgi:hypothetical protein